MPVTKLLIANRAEIAVRIVQSAAALGIRTVAVHPADDAACAHVAQADEAVALDGHGPAAYLDADALIRAALATGCDAVHPGYGFLSENAAFAEACTRAGLVFVGPDAETLTLLGDKSRARGRARELGIPVPEGTDGPTDEAAARAFLDGLGPDGAVMVKALAGGGGRGMRAVTRADDLGEALARARSEAEHAFGDGAVYVERLVPRARHIEVQLVGDGTGAVTHLGDRDCSLQRRRQKLVELAPAPGLDAEVRRRLHDSAVAFGRSLRLRGLATVEFLVPGGDGDSSGHDHVFLEANPRIQVEHTVTEEVTDVDLVEAALRIAGSETLPDLGLTEPVAPRGTAVQLRVNTETLDDAGGVRPAAGVLTTFHPPGGRGVRVDTHGYAGYEVSPRYDSLLAKVVVSDRRPDPRAALVRAERALGAFGLAGVETNVGLLRALLERPEIADGRTHTAFVDERRGDLTAHVSTHPQPAASETAAAAPPGSVVVPSPVQGSVVALEVKPGDAVAAGTPLAVLESMKMEHVVTASVPGRVRGIAVTVGDAVPDGAAVAYLDEDDAPVAAGDETAGPDLEEIRPDLAEVLERRRIGGDEHRRKALARRRDAGRLTARESIAALCDADSFVEYGALAIAAQRQRRSLDDLIARTPADGLITGTARVDGRRCAVMAYDYTVLAGTQGIVNHSKTDRLFELVARESLPLVIFAEGGGGRPGDTDTHAVAQLDVPTFRMSAELAGRVPVVAIVSGYCFAGNAALAGVADVIIATEGSSLGMGGPAMIEGGGLPAVAAEDVGPMDVQTANGVVDVLTADDGEAIATARRYLSHVTGSTPADGECADQRVLRHLVPENRVRAYDIRPVIETVADTGSVLELRREFGVGIVTALARLDGRSVGILANNPTHLGGAIDADAADKAARFLTLCQDHGLPVVSLCDTPGFMVGPETERTASVRRFGGMFVAGARLTVPMCTVVLRKGYGLGAMAMAGGSLRAPLITVSWPTGEFGGMGLEGGVRLGYRKELEAIDDPQQRQRRYEELVAQAYERGKGLSTAAAYEIDDVIDPADTRTVLTRTLGAAAPRS